MRLPEGPVYLIIKLTFLRTYRLPNLHRSVPLSSPSSPSHLTHPSPPLAIDKYLNQPPIRSKLGIPKSRPEFSGCSERVNTAFSEHTDIGRTSEFHMAQLLERGVRVLLYDGVLDLFWCVVPLPLLSRILLLKRWNSHLYMQ